MGSDYEEFVWTDDGGTFRCKTVYSKDGKKLMDPLLKVNLMKGDSFYLNQEMLFEMMQFLAPTAAYPITLEWDKIDTSLVEEYSDEVLLEQIKNCKVITGWGLLAEVCKRLSGKSLAEGKA